MGQNNSIFRNDLADFITVSDPDYYCVFEYKNTNCDYHQNNYNNCVVVNSLLSHDINRQKKLYIIYFNSKISSQSINCDITSISRFLTIFFQIDVEIIENVDDIINQNKLQIKYQDGYQISAASIVDSINRKDLSTHDMILCITDHKIYSNAKCNINKFLNYKSKTAIYYVTHQSITEILHDVCHIVGHMYGLSHCNHYACIMNHEFIDHQEYNIMMCPNCFKKYYFSHEFNIRKRLSELYLYFVEHDLKPHSHLEKILKNLG